jgi:hypothetical protein
MKVNTPNKIAQIPFNRISHQLRASACIISLSSPGRPAGYVVVMFTSVSSTDDDVPQPDHTPDPEDMLSYLHGLA